MVQSSLGPYVNPVTESEPGYGQLLAVLVRRFPWFLAVFVASLAVAGLVTKRTPTTYGSSMQLLIEPNYQGKKEANASVDSQYTDPNIEIDAATQLNLMKSSELMEKAVSKLKPEYPDITVEALKSALALDQVKRKEDNTATKIFQIDYISTEPDKSYKVLETMRQVYLDYNIKQQDERIRRGLKVIREQIRKVNSDVTTAETNLQRFRRSENIINPDTQAKATEDELTRIQQERGKTRAEYQEADARYKNLLQQLQTTPETALAEARLSQSTRYQGLLNEIQKSELLLAQERLRFTEQAPSVQKLVEQLQSQKALLQQEQRRTLGVEAKPQVQGLLEQGQKGQIDLNLSSELLKTRTDLLALVARDQVLAKKEDQLRTELKRFPRVLAEYNRLEPQVQLNRDKLQQLLKAEQVLEQELDKGGYNWEVIEKPKMGVKLGPNLQQNLLLGGVVGLMLGGIAAFLREAADDSVHTTAELEKQVALPLLGTTPKLPPARAARDSVIKLPFGKPQEPAPWTIQVLQSSPRWESLDLIYKNIELLNSVSSFKSLMITAALPDEGKSALALGLAMSAARLHKRVLLIDANLREPSLHKQLNLPNEQGLSTLLASDVSIPNQISIQSSGSSYIDILTAGPTPVDPANLLSSPRMQQLMATFEENYDLVLVDSTPVLGLVDALLTASSCRGAIMVASIGKVTRTQMAQATAMLSRLNLLGVVASGVSNSGSAYIPYTTTQNRFALQQAMEK
ncbi:MULTISPECIES: GumC family protein [Nostocales]|uniref:Capsular biosynthesis protein n=3 Tax=Nostocales TaxID=1161 RepID=A0A0C1NAI8_9CYAN|nr:polysaccharide biosynthesis tyrosine autokinase [Tolypothrix bouteillei]KAF3884514.1 polysaccharide biosynthesis tyrosine autokinase [Tolypothrix bouteillei VB521301]